jgi:hypothetical protein
MEGGVIVINYNDCDTEGRGGWYCLGGHRGGVVRKGGGGYMKGCGRDCSNRG